MPRYTKDADAKIFKKRFKNLSHKSAAGVHAYMSQPKFRILQELAMHGLGYPTDFGESLPTHGPRIQTGQHNPLILFLSLRNNQSIFLQDGVDLSTINMSVTFLDVSQTVPDFPETF